MDSIHRRLSHYVTLQEKIESLKRESVSFSPELINSLSNKDKQEIGAFEIPQKLIDLIRSLLDESDAKTILDPLCGAGLLLHHLQGYKCIGFEENENALSIARMLNPTTTFEKRHIFRNPLHETYDAIVTRHFPFGQQARHFDQLLIWLMDDGLSLNGLLMMIVPNNVLTARAFDNVRRLILERYSLEVIVSLGSMIKEYSSLGLSMIVVRKAKQSEKVLFIGLEETGDEDSPTKVSKRDSDFLVSHQDLALRWDRNFHDPEFVKFERKLNRKGTARLEKLSDQIILGCLISGKDRKEAGKYLVLTPGNIQEGIFTIQEKSYYTDGSGEENHRFHDCLIHSGDILVSLLGPKFKTYIYKSEDPPAIANQNFAIIRAKDNRYINAFLNTRTGYSIFIKQVKRRHRGGTIPRLNLKDLKDLLVPVYPIEDLNQLVSGTKWNAQTETAIADTLTHMLTELGWELKKEYQKGDRWADYALFKGADLISILEVKSASRYLDTGSVINQLQQYKKHFKVENIYSFQGDQFYSLIEDELVPINDFPKPPGPIHSMDINNSSNIETFSSVDEAAPFYASNTKHFGTLADNYGFELIQEFISIQKKVNEKLSEIKGVTRRTEDGVNRILNEVLDLRADFNNIKTGPFEIFDKIELLNQELDAKIKKLLEQDSDSIKRYERIVRRWIEFGWDKLDTLSKLYLPSAEYLFSKLSEFEDPDLSPFIIQYCRALENEVLKKIFRFYVKDLQSRGVNCEELFAWDLGLKPSGKPNNMNTMRVAKHIIKCLRRPTEEWFFELGSMETILRYLTGKTAKKSPILKDLNTFILQYFHRNILELEFLDELKRITNEYRNRAAHPSKISVEEAKQGQKDIRILLKNFLEYYTE
jgi:hypothetical protein